MINLITIFMGIFIIITGLIIPIFCYYSSKSDRIAFGAKK